MTNDRDDSCTTRLYLAPARVIQIIWGYQPQQCRTAEFFLIELSNVLEVLYCVFSFVTSCSIIYVGIFMAQLMKWRC